MQAFGRAEWDRRRLAKLFTQNLQDKLNAIVLEARYGGLQNLIAFVSPFMILAVGAPSVIQGTLTVGYLLAFQQWTIELYQHARHLYEINQQIQQALGASERVFEFLDQPVDETRKARASVAGGARTLPNVKGELVFRDVSFSYDGEREVLRCLNLHIQAGTTVALVGPSGAGKSTVFSLVLRFFDPDSGTIMLDGVDLKELDAEWLRRQIGVVFRDPYIFAGTLFDNIAFGREGASRKEVLEAARMAYVDEFALQLPGGHETLVGEQGARLSGGQRQRIALARALLRKPTILLLDEATSALDPEAESIVHRAIRTSLSARTCMIIAHRLSTVKNADKIVFLRDGSVVEIGSHRELLERNGEYARFYAMQFAANGHETDRIEPA